MGRKIRIGSLLLILFVVLATRQPAGAQEEAPTIAKDSIQLRAWTLSSYHKNYDIFSWVPLLKYRVNGPIASGSQLYVEVSLAGATWVKFDCKTSETQPGYWWETECGGRDIPEEKGSTYLGPVKFAIKMRNELSGTNATLFTGTAKVGKMHSNEVGPKFANHWVYYVDHDWNLPIAYVFYTPDDVRGWKYPRLNFAVWVRGDVSPLLEPHLFHNGKEVGKLFYQGEEVGKPGCGTSEVENNTTQFTAPGPKPIWTRWRCDFPSIHAYNTTGETIDSMFGPLFLLSENPGAYDIKVLYKGHLARVLSFAVDADGKLVDNGIAKANKLGNNRVIVPVQVLGDMDGPWNRTAWKTDAFYGNPLTGFTAAPAATPPK